MIDPRWLRRAGRTAAAVAGLVGPAVVATGVIGTKLLTDAPRPGVRKPTLTARFFDPEGAREEFGVERQLVEVRGEEAFLPGTWGLRVEDAYVLMGDPVDIGFDEAGPWAARPYVDRSGLPPTFPVTGERRRGPDDRRADRGEQRERRRLRDRRRGEAPPPWPYQAVLSAYAWPDDPQVLAHHNDATWEIEAVPGEHGTHLPAWKFTPPDATDTWFIAVHGRGARRAETFRLVDIALRHRLPSLVVSYRTDAWTEAPVSLTTLGQHEWEDVEAAVRLALSRGAQRVVLAGCSMGGGIVASMLRKSELASAVSGVVLDSPALDWGDILRHVATTYRVPRMFVPVTMTAARLRASLDFHQLNHLAGSGEFAHPILLIHGTEDDVTPVWLSDTLAEARPDLVTFLRVEGAGHVKSWNHDPDRYEMAVATFLHQSGVIGEAWGTRRARRRNRPSWRGAG